MNKAEQILTINKIRFFIKCKTIKNNCNNENSIAETDYCSRYLNCTYASTGIVIDKYH
jgi:hypothetical protein